MIGATTLLIANRTRDQDFYINYSIQYNKMEYSEIISVGNIVLHNTIRVWEKAWAGRGVYKQCAIK